MLSVISIYYYSLYFIIVCFLSLSCKFLADGESLWSNNILHQ